MTGNKNKVVVIGLDGAEPSLMKSMIEAGRLPTFKRILRNGVFTPLASTIPAHSGPAWTTFATGMNPGKTGIFSFLAPIENYRQEHAFSNDVRAERFWETACRNGIRTGVVNVPLTFPPTPLDGFMISGLPSHEEASFPENFHINAYSNITMRIRHPVSSKEWARYLYNTLYCDLRRASALPELMKSNDIQLLVAVFDLLDRAQHRYWYAMDPGHPAHDPSLASEFKQIIPQCYITADRLVRFLMDEIGDSATYILLSDHGFRPTSKMYNLLKLFIDNNLIHLKAPSEIQQLSSDGFTSLNDLMVPERSMIYVSHPDLITSIGLNLNIKGREPLGCISAENAGTAKNKIIEILKSAIDRETNKHVFESVCDGEEIFHGPYASKGPDILAVSDMRLVTMPGFTDYTMMITPPSAGNDFGIDQLTANHAPYGIFMAIGLGIKRPEIFDREPGIADVAPTILRILGIPAPAEMDGKAIPILNSDLPSEKNTEPAKVELAQESSTGSVEPISEEEKRKAIEHLKGMGYL